MSKQELDLSKMSVADMLALARKLEDAAKEQSQKEFDTSMTFLNDKLKAMGRTKEEAMAVLYQLMAVDERKDFLSRFAKANKLVDPAAADTGSEPKKRAARGTGNSRKANAYQKDVTYKSGSNTWVGGTKGRRPPWLRDLIADDMPFDEAKAAYAKLAVK